MATLFCVPQPFTITASNSATSAQASNMAYDAPGMVWRSANLTTVYFTAQVGAGWDTIALTGNNLRASDTIRIRGAATEAATTSAPTYDVTISAWTGVAPAAGAISLLTLAATRNETFLRIDITSTGNPAGYVQVQRFVVGKRIENAGLDIGYERGPEDTSAVDEGLGYTSINRYNVRVSWKITISGMKEIDYETYWYPFTRYVGRSRAFLFVEESANAGYLQNRAAMCRFTGSAKGSAASSDYWSVDATLLSVN